MRAAAVFITAATIASTAHAAGEPICADRPGKASATCTAPAGHLQVETGLVDWSSDRSPGARDTQTILGATAVKYGIGDRAHIELDVAPYVHAKSRVAGVRDSVSGFGDTLVRWKQRLSRDDAALAVSAYPFVKLPTASHDIGNGKLEAGLAVPVGYGIPNSPLGITLGPEIDWLADDGGHGHHLAMVQVVSLGVATTSRLSVSAELWGAWDWDPSGTTRQASADASAAYLLSNDVQLDCGANFGLTRNTPDVDLYAGISKRF